MPDPLISLAKGGLSVGVDITPHSGLCHRRVSLCTSVSVARERPDLCDRGERPDPGRCVSERVICPTECCCSPLLTLKSHLLAGLKD